VVVLLLLLLLLLLVVVVVVAVVVTRTITVQITVTIIINKPRIRDKTFLLFWYWWYMGRAVSLTAHLQLLPRLETGKTLTYVALTPSWSAKGVTIFTFTPAILPFICFCCKLSSNHLYILVIGGKYYLSSISE
jgi:hypothetical protein